MKRSRTDHEEVYQDGEVIVRQGDVTREMYIVQQGEVVVLREIDEREVELTRLGRGKFFGELSLLESVPRSATVRAVGRTRLLVIKPGTLLLKIRRNPTFAFEMLQQMSSRVRDLTDRLSRLLASGELSEERTDELRGTLGLDVPLPAAEEGER